jgi:hypothetical protein
MSYTVYHSVRMMADAVPGYVFVSILSCKLYEVEFNRTEV